MKATSIREAWEIVNEIFPADYEHDIQSSARAGYPIYRSTADDHYYDYICDLGNRLEVNLDSSKLKTVNIWIETEVTPERPSEEDIKAAASNKFCFEPENALIVRFHVMGYKYENEAEQRVYRTMKKNEADRKMIAADLVVAYCEDKGIEWGTIKVTDITEYNNTADSAEGHFVIGAVVTKRVKG